MQYTISVHPVESCSTTKSERTAERKRGRASHKSQVTMLLLPARPKASSERRAGGRQQRALPSFVSSSPRIPTTTTKAWHGMAWAIHPSISTPTTPHHTQHHTSSLPLHTLQATLSRTHTPNNNTHLHSDIHPSIYNTLHFALA